MIRIVLYGLGPIGAGIARVVAARSDMRIVGAIEVNPAKVGTDVGEVIGLGRSLGVVVSADAPATLRSSRPDVAIHATSSHLEQVIPQLRQILKAGVNVVSTCEELSFPLEAAAPIASELNRIAQSHDVAILGTGINPGFAMDTLPLALTAVSQRVDSVRVLRIQDAARRRISLQKKVGAGLSTAEFEERVRNGTVRHIGLPESVHALANGLQWKVDRIEDHLEPVVAEQDTTGPDDLVIPAGGVLGVRQIARGIVDAQPLLVLELQMYLGAPNPHDHIVVEGLPRIEVTVNEGTHGDLATAAILVNAIPSLLRVEPGLRVMSDLPLVHYSKPGAVEVGPSAGPSRRTLAF